MSFTIRSATKDDLADLAYIHVQGWKDAYDGMVNPDYLNSLDAGQREKKWHEWFDPENQPVHMAFADDGSPAGFVNFGKIRTAPPGMSPIRPLYSGEVYAIYILGDYWRQGLGKQLMRTAAEGLAGMKHKSLCLWVVDKNKRACEFYKALGGERCGKMQVEIGPSKAREVCYGWRDTKGLLEL